jgi:hypothetical protein
MAEGMSGWRIVSNVVGTVLGFIIFGAGGCHIGGDCSCPGTPSGATIELGCVPTEPPVVKTTGPCSVCPRALPNGMIPEGSGCAVPDNATYIILLANGAGTCHVEVTFGSGSTSSVDVDFVSEKGPACCGGGREFHPRHLGWQLLQSDHPRSYLRGTRRGAFGLNRLTLPWNHRKRATCGAMRRGVERNVSKVLVRPASRCSTVA